MRTFGRCGRAPLGDGQRQSCCCWWPCTWSSPACPGRPRRLLAARKGVRSVPVLLGVSLAAIGAVGLLGFWTYYGGRVLGESFSYFVVLGSAGLIVWCLAERRIDRGLLRRLAVPLVAVGARARPSSSSSASSTAAPTRRSSPPRPVSPMACPATTRCRSTSPNGIFPHGHQRRPELGGEWLLSDRPPLQVGYALSQRPFGLGFRASLPAARRRPAAALDRRPLGAAAGGPGGPLTRALAMVTVLVSDMAIINGFFVWPKLLPAAMLLAAAALVMTPLWQDLRHNLWAAALVAALCALAMLGHGGSVFADHPAGRSSPPIAGCRAGAGSASRVAVGIVFMAPWSAYQKWGDPPGNRLVKWTLAGEPPIDDRGIVETIVDSYGEAGVGGTLQNKAQNFHHDQRRHDDEEALRRPSDTAPDRNRPHDPRRRLLLPVPLAVAAAAGAVRDGGGWRRRRPEPGGVELRPRLLRRLRGRRRRLGAARLRQRHRPHADPRRQLPDPDPRLRRRRRRPARGLPALRRLVDRRSPPLLSLAVYAPALDPPPGTSYSVASAI